MEESKVRRNLVSHKFAVIGLACGLLMNSYSVGAFADDIVSDDESCVIDDYNDDFQSSPGSDSYEGSNTPENLSGLITDGEESDTLTEEPVTSGDEASVGSFDSNSSILVSPVEADTDSTDNSSGVDNDFPVTTDEADSIIAAEPVETDEAQLSAAGFDEPNLLLTATESTTSVFSFTVSSCTIPVTESDTIYVSGNTGSATSWTSSNESVFTIQSSNTAKATIKGVGGGTALLKAFTKSGEVAVCEVTVTLPEFDVPETLELPLNMSRHMFFSFPLKIKSVSSSNSDIVSCKQESNNITLKADGYGTAIITIEDNYGRTRTCDVSVKVHILVFEKTETTITAGDYEYSYFTYESNSSAVSVTSGDESIATVSLSGRSVRINAVRKGDVTITAMDSYGETTTQIVHVVNPEFSLKQDEISVTADDIVSSYTKQGRPVSVVSADENIAVAYISSYNFNQFNIKGIKEGTTTITVTDAYGQTATQTVYVSNPEFSLQKSEVSMPGGYENKVWIKTSSGRIASGESADNKVAKIEFAEYDSTLVCVYGVSIGETDVTLKDKFGQICTLHVTITKPEFTISQSNLEFTVNRTYKTYSVSASHDITRIQILDNRIVRSSIYRSSCTFTPTHIGNTKVILYDNFGNSKTISVTVKESISFVQSSITFTAARFKNEESIKTIGDIKNMVSSDNSIIRLHDFYGDWSRWEYIIGDKAGTATIHMYGFMGAHAELKVTVTQDYINAARNYYNAQEEARKAREKAQEEARKAYEREYKRQHSYLYVCGITKKSKTASIYVSDARAGDTLALIIGKKKYTQTISSDISNTYVQFKIKKSKAGKSVTTQLIGADGQVVCSDYDIVYIGTKIKRGYTKKQVSQTLGWGDPDSTASASGGWSFWYYDDGSSISFKGGKVRAWVNMGD